MRVNMLTLWFSNFNLNLNSSLLYIYIQKYVYEHLKYYITYIIYPNIILYIYIYYIYKSYYGLLVLLLPSPSPFSKIF